MEYSNNAAVVVCGDNRLEDRVREVVDSVSINKDRTFVVRNVGGCLLLVRHIAFFVETFETLLDKGVAYFHIEDHAASHDGIDGCAMYDVEHELEMTAHSENLWKLVGMLTELAQRKGKSVSITVGVYVHNQAGDGEFRTVTSAVVQPASSRW